MTAPGSYSPLVTDYPVNSVAALLEFAQGIPDEGQRRLGIAIARTLEAATAAMSAARNARQMVLTRDERLDTFEERYNALAMLLDQQAHLVEAQGEIQSQLQEIAESYSAALPASVADRARLNELVVQLRADLTPLDGRITALTTALAGEISTRAGIDTALGGRIDTENAARIKAVADEAAARKAGDDALTTRAGGIEQAATALTTRVAATETKNSQQDTALAANTKAISDEASARTAADQTLTTNLAAETTRAQAAEQAASKAAADEATRAKAAEAAEATARQQGDSANAAAIGQEVADRKAGDSALGTRIDTEASARTAADSTLTTNLATEVTARQNGDSTNATAISNEATTRANADAALGTRVDNEVSTRAAADTSLGGRISTLEAAPGSALRFVTGYSYGPGGYPVTYSMTHQVPEWVPLYIPPGSPTIKAVQVESISAAGAGRVVRLGIWSDNGLVGTLLRDAGTVAATTVGLLKATLATPLAVTGMVWIGICAQGTTSGSPPQIRGLGGYSAGSPRNPVGQVGHGFTSTTLIAGAFPTAAPTVTTDSGNASPALTLLF